MNNLLKSVFISAYGPYAVVVTFIAAQKLYDDLSPGWLGVLLSHAPMGLFFMWVMVLRNLPRSHPWLPAISAITLAGVLLSFAGPLDQNIVVVVLGIAGAIAYLLYLFWYSRFHRAPATALRIGAALPEFSATDSAGTKFNTEDLRGYPAVLLFYRGNWCPLCMAQIKEIAASYKSLAEKKNQVILISPQPQTKSAQLAKRFDAPMRFVVDVDNRIARQLGIEWQHSLPAGMQVLGYNSESVLPTVIVVDATGTIVLADQTDNYRIRPEPESFIAALAPASGR